MQVKRYYLEKFLVEKELDRQNIIGFLLRTVLHFLSTNLEVTVSPPSNY